MTEHDTEVEASTGTKIISTHEEAGYAPRDVLNDAEQGDDIRLEMHFSDHPFVSVRGTVANVTEGEATDEGLVAKTVQVEAVGDIEMVNVGLRYSVGYVSLRDEVRFVKRGADDYVFAELDALNYCELERAVDMSAEQESEDEPSASETERKNDGESDS